ncbi:MAG: DUF423 domain-containing protein [Spirochaetales bacterium]|nr:DUF423 domain-containing protein [Spirochaetales bacterium]
MAQIAANTHKTLVLTSLSGALAVALGAFGAHALGKSLDADALKIYHTANQYHFWHTLALLFCSLSAAGRPGYKRVAMIAFTLGLLLFCGPLYLYAVSTQRFLALVTPLGGVAFLVGWVCLAISFTRRKDTAG